ncbi:hypothetical protein DYJ22_09260 [Salmonella enterica]|nr:hypothetical protein [Salmonella enterica]
MPIYKQKAFDTPKPVVTITDDRRVIRGYNRIEAYELRHNTICALKGYTVIDPEYLKALSMLYESRDTGERDSLYWLIKHFHEERYVIPFREYASQWMRARLAGGNAFQPSENMINAWPVKNIISSDQYMHSEEQCTFGKTIPCIADGCRFYYPYGYWDTRYPRCIELKKGVILT